MDAIKAAFAKAQMMAPADVDALVKETPRGTESQIHAVSVMEINLDDQSVAKYLHKLAQAYTLDAQSVNDIYYQLGVPSLYA